MYVGLSQLNNLTNTQIPFYFMKAFKVIPPSVAGKVHVNHPHSRLGERNEEALMVWRGVFSVCFLVPVLSAAKFENYRFGTHIFISKLFLTLSR